MEARRFTWPYEAELARAFLESHGVHAVVFDTQSALYSDGAIVGIRLMVLDDDAADAERVLADSAARAGARSARR